MLPKRKNQTLEYKTRIVYSLIVIAGISLLPACGPSGVDLGEPTAGPTGEVTTPQGIVTEGARAYEAPPPLTNGSFTQLMPTAINQVLFPEQDAGDFSVLGWLEEDGLLIIYLDNGRSIYYAVSSDGADWALYSEPIFSGLISDDFEFHPTSITVLDQRYAIYMGVATIDYAEHNFLYSIWALTSSDPTGPWVLDESPSLYEYAGEGSYALYLASPIVRPYLDGLRMYYAYSFTLENIVSPDFAVAHSWDGVSWRYTPDLPTEDMDEGVVRLSFSSEHDGGDLMILDVWPTQTGWQMLYRPHEVGEGPGQMLLAESEDGLEWTPSEIAIQVEGENFTGELVSASALFYQGRYLLSYCIMPQSRSSQCYITENINSSSDGLP